MILYEAFITWEGMFKLDAGKNYSGLIDIMNIFSIDNKKRSLTYLKLQKEKLQNTGAMKQKQQESLNKAKRVKISGW